MEGEEGSVGRPAARSSARLATTSNFLHVLVARNSLYMAVMYITVCYYWIPADLVTHRVILSRKQVGDLQLATRLVPLGYDQLSPRGSDDPALKAIRAGHDSRVW